MSDKRIYRIQFHNQGRVYEIYAHSVGSAQMFGFIEVAEITFGEKSAIVLDPTEDGLKTEFGGVSRTYIPMHSIIRIDEVEKQGHARITDTGNKGTITPFPVPFYGASAKPDASA